MSRASISVCKGKGSIAHNNREFIAENVISEKTKDNIIYKQESLEQAYKKCFEKAINDYNLSQKRKDRLIQGVKGYIEHIKNSKNKEKLFYENIVQVGNMYDSKVGTKQGDVCIQILDKYMREFEHRNPNLYVFNAVLHLDEQTPHLHIDYIPLAHNYKQGLKTRNSLDRAFKEQGIEGKSNKYENRTIAWQNREKSRIETLMKQFGLERESDRGLKQDHFTVEQYKAIADRVRNEVKELPRQIESSPTFFGDTKVVVNKKELKKLEKRAKLSIVHETSVKELVEGLEKSKKEIDVYSNSLKRKNKELIEKLDSAKEFKNKYEELYHEQLMLNHYNRILKNKSNALEENKTHLEHSLDDMCHVLANTVKAFNMLKYDDRNGYKINLNEKQERLFNAIKNYAEGFLDKENRQELIEDMSENIGFSKGIREHIQKLEPKKTRNIDMER